MATKLVTRSGAFSMTYKGTAFEEKSLRVLKSQLSMSLRRVGGKSDGGVDLLGWWWLPSLNAEPIAPGIPNHRRRLRVLAQCKAERKNIGPKYVRELEGVMHRYLTWPNDPVLLSHHDEEQQLDKADGDACHGIVPIADVVNDALPSTPTTPTAPAQCPLVAMLISESPFTKATLLRAQSSSIPFFLLHLPPTSTVTATAEHQHEGPMSGSGSVPGPSSSSSPSDNGHERIGAVVWNSALSGSQGVLRNTIEARWEHPHPTRRVSSANPIADDDEVVDDSGAGGGRPGLWWCGHRLKSWTPDDADV